MANFIKGAFIGMVAGAAVSMVVMPPSKRRMNCMKRKATKVMRSAASMINYVPVLRG